MDALACEGVFLRVGNAGALRVAVVNLMPKKQETERQLLRLLNASPLDVYVTFLYMQTHVSKNTPAAYLSEFYQTFADIRETRFDGLIITGAPVETLPFEAVAYWNELCGIMEWSKTHVYSTFHICWGAQAALYYHYGVPKYPIEAKKFGIFPHTLLQKTGLTDGFDDVFYAPHSRHTEIKREDIVKVNGLSLLSESQAAGVYIVASKDGRQIFVTGHSEYEPDTLRNEYERDIQKGAPISPPVHYFTDDDPAKPPKVTWRAHARLLYTNWLHGCAAGL
jgi:homoserine O-succinyltransferase